MKRRFIFTITFLFLMAGCAGVQEAGKETKQEQKMSKEDLIGRRLIKEGNSFYQKGQWKEALGKYTEALKVYRELGDVAGEALSLNNIGGVYYSLGQYQQALDYYKRYLEIRHRIGDVAGEALSLNNIGSIYRRLGQYQEALNYCNQSLEIRRRIGDAAGEADSLNSIGIVYYRLGQYQEALNYCKRSLEIKRRIGDVAGEADSLIDIGNVYYSLGQYQEALHYYQQSLGIKRRIGDVAGEARSLNNIGNVYYSLGQYQESLNYRKQSLEIKRRIGDMAGEANSLNNIGSVYGSLGQYQEALNCYQQSLEIRRRIGDVAGEADSLNNIGSVYRRLGQYQEALNYCKRSLEIKRSIGDVAGEADSLNSTGSVHGNLGQHQEALKYFKQSLEIRRRIGDVAGEALSLNNIGSVCRRSGQYLEALDYYKQSLEIRRRIGDVAGEADSLSGIGDVYESLGQYQEALKCYQQSLEISERLGELEALWRTNRGLGHALWKSGKAEEAAGRYQKAIDTIEELYGYTMGLKEEERSSLMGEKSFVYKEFLELLLELLHKYPDKGFEKQGFLISEKSKSRTFQELMAKAGAKTVFAGNEIFRKMIEREQQLMVEVTNLRGLMTQEMSKPEQERNREVMASLKGELSRAEKSLSGQEKEIEAKYPRYADLKRPKSLTMEDLQSILRPDETLLSYAVGKEKVVTFVIGKDRFKLIELPLSPRELTGLIKQFVRGLDDVSGVEDLEKFRPEIAHELYREIFEPLSSELKGVTRLYISADGVLYTLPFEALVNKEIDIRSFREVRSRGRKGDGDYLAEYGTLHYLIETYTITYLPSASVLRSLRKYEKPGYGRWDKPLIAFADPIFSPEEEERTGGKKGFQGKGISKETELAAQVFTRSTGSGKLERLKESAQEAEAIAKELKGKREDIYLREKATEEKVYQTKLREARYILFSTHGLLGGDFSGVAEPALVLTLTDNPPGRDGFLTMSKVLGLDLNAELVILSACNTSGRGEKAGGGEGFAGLTRSFMYAGSKSLLVTHWSVESEAARDLMVNTFKNMNQEARPEALRKAKLTMKSSSRQVGKEKLSLSHPFFWAPFVWVGEGR